MTPVAQVAVTAAAAAIGAVAYATSELNRFGRLPLLIGTGFLAACAPLTTLLRAGPPRSALRFGGMVVGYLVCVTAFLIVGAALTYAVAKVFLR